ncbi:MAG TPA: fused MFS/spermidine synthase [Tepidisphaeraceae bacterium]|nr:fused MFS/spermidine synthase [Tepidisphaeraceae bacterium]
MKATQTPRLTGCQTDTAISEAVREEGVVGRFAFPIGIFAGAFLLFSVQPLIGKYILPWFGGSAGVWTVCMLFFQTLLLAGYVYAHLSIRFLRPRGQAIVHAILLVAAIALLPITPAESWKPQTAGNPTWQILLLLGASLGLPYFVLSATAPILQAWFSKLNPSRSPYRLYALSNAASLLALLSYPFLVEPATSRIAQARLWSCGFVGFTAAFGACALLLARRDPKPLSPVCGSSPGDKEHVARGSWILWILLPACACALLLGTTNKICQDVAVVPFLWVLPLTLYLLTFIIPFENLRWYSRPVWVLVLLLVEFAMLGSIFADIKSILFRTGVFSVILLSGCMICHGELARLKPPPSRLTFYYLCIAIGGVLGGLSVALLAPLIFDGFYELYAAVILCCVILLGVMLLDPQLQLHKGKGRLSLYTTIPVCILTVLLFYAESVNIPPASDIITRQRNFYGVATIYDENVMEPARRVRSLRHGVITHGVQPYAMEQRFRPASYYGSSSGVARVLRTLRPDQPRRIGVIGLGVGTLSAFGKAGDVIKFYELDPDIEKLARTHFWYLSNCAAKLEFAFGDGRLSLEREQPQNFDVLIVDAFSSDSIPVHLLTRQAVEIYFRHLKPDGALVIHISNKYLNLQPVLARLAEDAGLHAVLLNPVGELRTPEDRPRHGDLPSYWGLLTHNQSLVDSPNIKSHRVALQRIDGFRLWTDDYTSLLPILR